MIQTRERGNAKSSKASKENEPQNPREAHSRMLLRLEEEIARPAPMISAIADTAQRAARTGSARAFLLNTLSAAQNREGDRFQAVLAEPVRFGGQMFGAGSIVEAR